MMTTTGRTLAEYLRLPDGLIALVHFAQNLGMDSATICAASGHERQSDWALRFKTNAILADVYDAVSAFNYSFIKAHSKKKKPKRPKPYPRPWVKEKHTKRFGRGAIPIKDFWKWWNNGER